MKFCTLQVSDMVGSGRGYFKMVRGPHGNVVSATGVKGACLNALRYLCKKFEHAMRCTGAAFVCKKSF